MFEIEAEGKARGFGDPRAERGAPGRVVERRAGLEIRSRPAWDESRVTGDAPSVSLERAVAQAQHGRTRGGGCGSTTQRPSRFRRAKHEGDD